MLNNSKYIKTEYLKIFTEKLAFIRIHISEDLNICIN